MPPKASPTNLILFDLGKVLIDFDFKIAVRRLQKLFPVDVFKLAAFFRASGLAEDFDRGMISENDFFKALQEEMNFPISMEKFILHWNGIFTEKKEMADLARHFKKHYKVSILSNTNCWHVSHLRKNHEWVFKFDDFVASCEVQLMKPDPKIYHLALKRAGAAPEETLYIDDLPKNVAAAKALGIDAIRFRNHAALLSELKKRNLRLPA